MAKGGHPLLCLLILATLAGFGLGFNNLDTQVGTIQVYNGADYDITILNEVHYIDGHGTADPGPTLFKGTTFNFQVMNTMDTVRTLFTMYTNTNQEFQQLTVDWSSVPGVMVYPCIPNCFWVVDDRGFSVASSAHGQLQFVDEWVQVA